MMSYFKLTAGALAEAIGVQPSSVSHVLSGRNRPSLDFVLRILEQYPEVSSDWLLHGSGKMLKERGGDSPKQGSLFGLEEEGEAEVRLKDEQIRESVADAASEQETVQQESGSVSSARSPSRETAAKPYVQKPAARRVLHRNQSVKSEAAQALAQEDKPQSQRRIEKIVIFYSDRTFEEFAPTGGLVDKL